MESKNIKEGGVTLAQIEEAKERVFRELGENTDRPVELRQRCVRNGMSILNLSKPFVLLCSDIECINCQNSLRVLEESGLKLSLNPLRNI